MMPLTKMFKIRALMYLILVLQNTWMIKIDKKKKYLKSFKKVLRPLYGG